MKKRSELKRELKRLEQDNATLRAALLERVNIFLHTGKWLGTYQYTIEVRANGKLAKVAQAFDNNSFYAEKPEALRVARLLGGEGE